MAIEDAIVVLLGGLVDGRIYPMTVPQPPTGQPTFPAITYQRIDTRTIQAHDANGAIVAPRFQFDAWARGYTASKTLVGQIRNALRGYRGTVAGIRINGGIIRGERDQFDPETGRYHHQIDVDLWHTE